MSLAFSDTVGGLGRAQDVQECSSTNNVDRAQGSNLLRSRPGKGEIPFLRQGSLPKENDSDDVGKHQVVELSLDECATQIVG